MHKRFVSHSTITPEVVHSHMTKFSNQNDANRLVWLLQHFNSLYNSDRCWHADVRPLILFCQPEAYQWFLKPIFLLFRSLQI